MSTDEDIYQIKKIQFNIFTNDAIYDYSVVNKDKNGINLPESYENSEPKRGGLVDTRLGITDSNIVCATCGLSAKLCCGHFGHTNLGNAIFHYGFFPIVKNILSCICLRSSQLLLRKNQTLLNKIIKTYKGKKRFNEIKKHSSLITYSNIGVPVPKIKEEKKKNTGALYFIAETNLSNIKDDENVTESNKIIKENLYSYDVYNILRNISDEDFDILGFNSNFFRPEDLLIINFPIPPVAIRPSLRADFLAQTAYEDDLTHKLVDIIKTNEKYKIQKEKEMLIGEESKYTNDLFNFLQYHCITYFDNDKSAFLTSEQKVGGKKFKSISERIKSKRGRIRGNLMGKRVNFSARTVITSDPNLELNQLGVPIKIAMEITYPETVSYFNYDKLIKMIDNGRYKYPGANFIIQKLNNQIREFDLRYTKKDFKLNYGDIVERHLMNDDVVLFNRQPSLHKLSMMCHKIFIINDKNLNTFRLNVNVTPPYNADFDGDEMNLFAPQSIQSSIELSMLADVNKHIISAKDSMPIISPVQDSVIGVYQLSLTKNKLIGYDVMNLLCNCIIDKTKLNIKKDKLFEGNELYSFIIPNDININNNNLVIDNGNIKKGLLKKGLNKQIIINCWDKYNIEETPKFIHNIQKLIINWLLNEGFSVGIKDCIIKEDVKKIINTEIDKKQLEIGHLITEIENNSSLLSPYIFEQSIKNNLMTQKGDIQKIVINEIKNYSNNFFVMVDSGAKGKALNIMQICGSLGQDIFKKERMAKEVNNRTTSHSFKNDDRAYSRGYITSSYYDGLKPIEFFFHHMTGREGLIDTAIKTAETGYISRKLMKGLEDISLKYDMTVRTNTNIILQYIYGDNNLDHTKLKDITLNSLILGDSEIYNRYCFSDTEIKNLSKLYKIPEIRLKKINEEYYNDFLKCRDNIRLSQKTINLNYKIIIKEFKFSINFDRLIVSNKLEKNNNIVDPIYIIEKINELIKTNVTRLICYNKKHLKNKNYKITDEQDMKILFKYVLLEYFSPKIIFNEYKFTKNIFDNVFNEIKNNFNNSQISPGEMVGSLAAQHIGEPSTQMTLNTFHATGSGSAQMLGVPRVEELTRCTKNIKTPVMNIYLKDNKMDEEQVSKIGSLIKYTTIKHIINKYEIIYDPNTKDIGYTKLDKTDNPFNLSIKSGLKNYDNMNWLFRIKLNKEKMLEIDITLLEIKVKFIEFFKEYINDYKVLKKNEKYFLSQLIGISILSNYDNNIEPIIHIRFEVNTFDYDLLLNFIEWIINNFKLKGLNKINNINIDNNSRIIEYDKDNKLIESNEKVIYTEGINMLDIRFIPEIDLNRTYCNEINIINKYYGIEAARSALLKEFNQVYNEYNLNPCHLTLLVDLITNMGIFTSIDRHGINKLDSDPLSRASFEMPIEQLLKASVFNEIDEIKTVSSRIMAGRVINGGTGLCKLILNNDLIINSEFIEDTQVINRSSFNKLKSNILIDDILNRSDFNIFKVKYINDKI